MLLSTRQSLPAPKFRRGASLKAVLAAIVAMPLALSVTGQPLPQNSGSQNAAAWSDVALDSAAMTAGDTVITFDEGRSELSSESHWRSIKSKSTKNVRKAPAPGTGSASIDRATRSGIFTTVPSSGFSLFPSQKAVVPSPLPRSTQAGGSYRTMCVRLCDGYYWPVSFATGRNNLRSDAAACENSCGSPARLFVYNNPGSGPEEMVDLKGRRYDRLKTAWNYRETYSAQCTCKPHPWEQASLDRHRKFAELQKAGKLSLYADNSRKRSKKSSSKVSYADLAAFEAATGNANGGLSRLERANSKKNPLAKAVSSGTAKQVSPRPLASVVFGNENRLGVKPRIAGTSSAKPAKASAGASGRQKAWQKRAFQSDR